MSIHIALPDKSIKKFDKPLSIADLALSIGPGLAKSAVAGKVNGELVDIRHILNSDAQVSIVTLQNPESVQVIRHSAAHIMAQAIQKIWPEVKITIGPVIESGFFYDLDSPRNFVPEDLALIEKEMQIIVDADYEIKKEEWPVEKAIETFSSMGERFKVEIIEDLKRNEGAKSVTVYYQGDWFDLCRGPHVPRTSFLKAFKLLSIAGAYWRGDEKNPMLQRIYGTAFSSKKDLDQYLVQIEEAKKRDHRKLGKDLDLFLFHPWSPASPFFLPKGTVLYNELLKFIREQYHLFGYSEVVTPQIFETDLYKCSGHYDNYKENMYFASPANPESGNESASAGPVMHESCLKPMNCPGHALIFKSTKRSYRELPYRMADFGRLHRYERAGVVHGLARVRSFSQDDAHIFCTLEQVQEEIRSFMSLLANIYKVLGFNEYKIYFSTRPEPSKRIGDDAIWDKAEGALEAALKTLGLPYSLNSGDGAFYGPKLDIMVTDAIGRAWQLGTIQCDFNMANRFELEYVGEDNKPHPPVVLHRAVLGSLERFMAVFIENCAGAFPTWISPQQVVIINITREQEAYAQNIHLQMRSLGIRSELDLRNEKLGFKIREAQLQKIPYMIILGDKEVNEKTISVRTRKGTEYKGIPVERFITNLMEEIKTRKAINHLEEVPHLTAE